MCSYYKGDHNKGEIEIIEPVRVFTNEFLEVYNDKVIFPSGYEGTYIRVEYPNDLSVAVLPVTNDGKIVLIRTFRHGMRCWGYEIPKGGVGIEEKPEHAALRELFEETGLTCEKLKYIGEYAESPAISGGKLKCYIAENCKEMGDSEPEKTEAISGTCVLTPDDYFKLPKPGYLDAVSELLIYRYIFGKKG